jgi:hypothetical protein
MHSPAVNAESYLKDIDPVDIDRLSRANAEGYQKLTIERKVINGTVKKDDNEERTTASSSHFAHCWVFSQGQPACVEWLCLCLNLKLDLRRTLGRRSPILVRPPQRKARPVRNSRALLDRVRVRLPSKLGYVASQS